MTKTMTPASEVLTQNRKNYPAYDFFLQEYKK
jgi:hypothetical protein